MVQRQVTRQERGLLAESDFRGCGGVGDPIASSRA